MKTLITLTGLLSALLILFVPSPTFAQITTPEEWSVDNNLLNETPSYKQLTDVNIIKIPINPDFNFESEEELIKALYYHYVFKLGFSEPIVNLLVTPSQDYYQLTSQLDSQVAHTNSSGLLVIGVLTTEDDYFTSLFDKDSFTQLLADLCSDYRISPNRISASDYLLTAGTAPSITFTATSSLEFQDIVNTAKTALPDMITSPNVSVEFSAEEFTLQLDPNTIGDIEIEIVNQGATPLYGGETSSILLKSKTNKLRSVFYSDSWVSLVSGGQIVEDRVGPLESGTLRISVRAPLLSGEHSETFVLIGTAGAQLSEQEVTITVTTNDIGQKVLEVQDTGTNYLNIRSTPSGVSSVVDRSAIGAIYLFDLLENGYYHILNGDSSGWVSSRYVKVLEE